MPMDFMDIVLGRFFGLDWIGSLIVAAKGSLPKGRAFSLKEHGKGIENSRLYQNKRILKIPFGSYLFD
ncbi:hypothetical protein L1987_56185 [Smallanthus sonchifolius]|uniref:Uncharacterized protein n=1 Tax=Smallanthus sonchifolius TaxID=185202 RepID=A0ACB9ECG0_9ASTR|nr:hypothetical protein L1987_56185 [Smallanthus sonchifolius]